MKRLGLYLIFLGRLFTNREPMRVYLRLTLDEMIIIGYQSILLVAIISTFIGAVTAVQTSFNLVSPLVPHYVVGTIVRDMTVLELSTTFTCVILAGKVGSNIAGGLGTMRITEQIDALEIMGINSASFLVLPKIVAGLVMFPVLVIFSGFLSLVGGYLAIMSSDVVTPYDYVYGIRAQFVPYNITFALIKSIVFGFLITSISSFRGYFLYMVGSFRGLPTLYWHKCCCKSGC
ncbi:MAG: ABC transporter permease [Bacteroidota bacterium]